MPFDLYDYQFDWLIDRSPQRACLKARQVGMSQTIAAEALHTARFNEGATILFVSRSLDAALNLLEYAKDILIDLDDGLPVTVSKRGATRVVFSNRSRILSVPATVNTGRTYAATAVYLDEAAFLPWADTIYTAVSPTTSRGGSISVLSTPNGQGNFFHSLWELNKFGKGLVYRGDEVKDGWSKHRVHWRDCPEYDEAWFKNKRPQFDEASWYSEFECDFERSGQPVFHSHDITEAANGWMGDLTKGVQGRWYVTAWDIGRRRDATVGVTLDITEPVHHVVKVERFESAPIPYIQRKIVERYHAFPGTHLVEANEKGDAVIENIDLPPNALEPFWTNAVSKSNLITALQWAFEMGQLKFDSEGVGIYAADSLRMAEELRMYRWDDKHIVQDTVMALGIAEHKVQWRDEEQQVDYQEAYHIEGYEGESGLDFVDLLH